MAIPFIVYCSITQPDKTGHSGDQNYKCYGRRGVVGKHELSPLGYFSLILFAFVQWSMLGRLKLSVSDVIVSQKGSNGDRKLHFFGLIYFTVQKRYKTKPEQANGDYKKKL